MIGGFVVGGRRNRRQTNLPEYCENADVPMFNITFDCMFDEPVESTTTDSPNTTGKIQWIAS